MSHVVTIKTQVRDLAAIAAACQRLGLARPEQGTAKLFSGQEFTGQIVRLPGWHFPVVCDTATGELNYDNFSGSWGEERALHQFIQSYAAEKAKIEARKLGHSVTEQTLTDGSIKLTINVGRAV
jgi:hypothetical protein